jgi:hypothetical protein
MNDLTQQTRDLLVWLAAVDHSMYHQKDQLESVPWRSCPHPHCQRVVEFLDATMVPDGAEHEVVTTLSCHSIYGAQTHQGLVVIEIGGVTVQTRTSEAREFALNILRCAEAADTDEFLLGAFSKLLGTSNDESYALLALFRKERERKEEGAE